LRWQRTLSAIIFATTVSLFSAIPAQAADYVPGEIVVQVLPGVNVNVLAQALGLQVAKQSQYSPTYLLRLPSYLTNLINLDALVASLRLNPLISAADPNLLMTLPIDGSNGTAGTQWTSTFVDRKGANDANVAYAEQPSVTQAGYQTAPGNATGAGAVVAVLDSGLSPRQPFLAAQAVPGWNFVNGTGNTDDAPDSQSTGTSTVGVGHGTMVSGVVYRFAPGASLMPIKILDSTGTGTLWNAAEGVRYAAAHGAGILNLSIACKRSSTVLDLAVTDATLQGAVVVAAAGNSNSSTTYSPASSPTVLTVAALNPDNTKACFSNYGHTITVDAPGVDIVSTYWDGRFAVCSGTSFASPMVAAEAALIRSVAPQLSSSAVRNLIAQTAKPVDYWNPEFTDQLGAGLINIDVAVGSL